jgi:hypothetical protein
MAGIESVVKSVGGNTMPVVGGGRADQGVTREKAVGVDLVDRAAKAVAQGGALPAVQVVRGEKSPGVMMTESMGDRPMAAKRKVPRGRPPRRE